MPPFAVPLAAGTGLDPSAPESQILTGGQYRLIFYSVVVAAFALLGATIYSWLSRSEVSSRYRPAVIASSCITAIAFVSYLVLIVKVDTGYDLVGGMYHPNAEAAFTIIPRYMDWTVTVPLLTMELLAVCSLAGTKARSLRFTTVAAAFLMIVTGYFGVAVFSDGAANKGALWLWGLISTAFYIYLYIALIGAVKSSTPEMSPAAATSLRNAAILLLSTFGVYPLVYAARVFFDSSAGWTTTMQVAFCAADITAKVGFGVLIHKVAKLRTAEDVAAGEDTHPEPVWVSNVKLSDGVQPVLLGVGRDGVLDLRDRDRTPVGSHAVDGTVHDGHSSANPRRQQR